MYQIIFLIIVYLTFKFSWISGYVLKMVRDKRKTPGREINMSNSGPKTRAMHGMFL